MSVFVLVPKTVTSSAHSVLLVFTLLILHSFSLQTLRAQWHLPQWQWTKVRQRSCTKPAKGQGQLETWAAEALNLTAQLREVVWSLCDFKVALSRKDNRSHLNVMMQQTGTQRDLFLHRDAHLFQHIIWDAPVKTAHIDPASMICHTHNKLKYICNL